MKGHLSAPRAGFLLGLVMLVSFIAAGRGIGASGAFAATAGRMLEVGGAAPQAAALADRIPTGEPLLGDWIVLEILALMAGGFLSAGLAGRLVGARSAGGDHADGAKRVPGDGRLVRALVGGTLMGVGARLAYGCTSGLALTGGALLVTGAWVFIPLAFAAAIAVTFLAREAQP